MDELLVAGLIRHGAMTGAEMLAATPGVPPWRVIERATAMTVAGVLRPTNDGRLTIRRTDR